MHFFDHDPWGLVLSVNKHPFERLTILIWNGILVSRELDSLEDIDLAILL